MVPLMLFLRGRCCKAALNVGDDFSGSPLPFSLMLHSSLVFTPAGVFSFVKTSLHVLDTFLRATLAFTVVIHSFLSLCYGQESGYQ